MNFSAYREYIQKMVVNKKSVISFPNNQQPSDAILTIPYHVFGNEHIDCENISEFAKTAPDEHWKLFWQEVAQQLSSQLEKDTNSRWLNTHGLGVSYLHVRIDEKPKYYSNYTEYQTDKSPKKDKNDNPNDQPDNPDKNPNQPVNPQKPQQKKFSSQNPKTNWVKIGIISFSLVAVAVGFLLLLYWFQKKKKKKKELIIINKWI